MVLWISLSVCVKGYAISIKISEDEYKKRLECCKNNLHSRLLLSKGNSPIKTEDQKNKPYKLWKPLGQWRMISLGKGYYEFSFATQDDLQSVWAVGDLKFAAWPSSIFTMDS